MRAPDSEEVAVWIAALENVPRLPSYATRALGHLANEVRRARREEQRLREALETVKQAVAEVET